jgi:hypothetical protein
MFRVHECVFFAHVFADLSGALTCGKAFSATCTCEGYSSQELWRIEGTQILWEYKGVKTATCCKENHVLESLQRHSGFEAPTASTAKSSHRAGETHIFTLESHACQSK